MKSYRSEKSYRVQMTESERDQIGQALRSWLGFPDAATPPSDPEERWYLGLLAWMFFGLDDHEAEAMRPQKAGR